MSGGGYVFIPTRALALAKALELKRLLEAVAERADEGPGSCAEFACLTMDDVIGYLIPEDEIEQVQA